MLTIWGRADASNVQAVLWGVGELGLPYRRIDAGHRFGGLDTPDFKELNPNRTVPVIRDEGLPCLWESGAILRYLARQYGPASFWPADPASQARVDQWAEWAKINVAMVFANEVFAQIVRTPPSRRDQPRIDRGLQTLQDRFEIAEGQFQQQDYLAGNNFTLADIPFGHILYRYFMLPVERPPRPALDAYYARLRERPAFAEHIMVSFEALWEDD
ncbi:MAG: glutathione S-transferase family protein [Alphaproteobacteria bacterium]